jgi:predicted amidohydrolase YtcJ
MPTRSGAALERSESARSAAEQEAELRERVELAAREALSNGVTTFHDAGTSFADIDFLKMLEAEGALPLRLYIMVRFESNAVMDRRLPEYLMPAGENDYLVVRSIKRQVDGALGSHGAWLLQPYIDLPDSTGLVLEPVEEIERTAEIAIRHGFQLNTHAIGDRANREMLDLYQRTFVAHGVDGADLRWRVEHAQHLDPVEVPRFAELGVIASMQGVHATSDGPWLHTRLGEERTARTSYLWRDLIDSGALVTNGTDVPVERVSPIASYYASVSRLMNTGERLTPGQAMTRMEALKSYTVNNAYAAFEEDVKGSLTPGKLADIVVLSQDLLTVEEAKIPDTEVVLTIVGGEIRHDSRGAH